MAAVAAFVDSSSAGTITTKPGKEQASEMSSIPIWEAPSSPIEIPAWLPTTLTSRPG